MPSTQKKPPGSLYGPLARRADDKIHALTDARGLPLELVLTPGQAGDCPVAAQLLGHLRENTIVLTDKAYDADWLRRQIEAAGAAFNIPPWPTGAGGRASAQCSIAGATATRYEKHASNFLAMPKLAAAQLWLRHNESVA
jgi:transposase